MNFIPIFFKIDRPTIMPILRITGTANQEIPGIEKIMLWKSVDIIEKAKKYRGQEVCPTGAEDMKDIPKAKTAVRFYIAFLNDKDLEQARIGLPKELG